MSAVLRRGALEVTPGDPTGGDARVPPSINADGVRHGSTHSGDRPVNRSRSICIGGATMVLVPSSWRRRICTTTAVDRTLLVGLLTPASPDCGSRPTTSLTSVAQRLRCLHDRRVRVHAMPRGTRLREVIEEMHYVSVSLTAALDAERALRINRSATTSDQARQSPERIARRTSELDMATREVATMPRIHG